MYCLVFGQAEATYMKLVIPDHTKDEVFSLQFKGTYFNCYYYLFIHSYINRKFYTQYNQGRVSFSTTVSAVNSFLEHIIVQCVEIASYNVFTLKG